MSALLFEGTQFGDGLYTYNYIVQNDSPSTIWNIDLFIGAYPPAQGNSYPVQPIPAPYTAPLGWEMYGAFSGSIAYPPYNMNGGFYEFYGYSSIIQPNTTAAGFSVTTPYAPTLDNGANDFFLYGSGGIVAYGNVVVPSGADWLYSDPPATATPLPSAFLMMIVPVVWLIRRFQ